MPVCLGLRGGDMLVRVDGFDAIADGDQVDASRPGGDGEQAPLGGEGQSHGASDAQVERAGSEWELAQEPAGVGVDEGQVRAVGAG